MEIHKPKPIHSLRELASEIGVIVVGILIALGLEQAIEAYHERERANVAREAIEAELLFSAAKAHVIFQMRDCSERQLVALSNAIGQGDQVAVQRLVATAQLPYPFTWSSAAWQSALASGASEHFTAEQLRSYSILYGIVNTLDAKQQSYADARDRLRSIALSGLSRSPAAASAELSEMAQMSSSLGAMQEIFDVYQDTLQNLLHEEVREADIAVLPNSYTPAKCEAVAAALGRNG